MLYRLVVFYYLYFKNVNFTIIIILYSVRVLQSYTFSLFDVYNLGGWKKKKLKHEIILNNSF